MNNRHEAPVHVLIVDDELEAAGELGEALTESFHFEVTVVLTGPEAVERVAQQPHHFQVALIDHNLRADMDGVEVMRRLFQHNRFLPVLLFTGLELQDDYVQAIKEGAYLYLNIQKGVTPITDIGTYCMQAVIDRATRRHERVQEISEALHSSRDMHQVFDTYVRELDRLGYCCGAIYAHVGGWTVGEEVTPGFRQTERRVFLRQERVFGTPALPPAIDLSEPSRIKTALDDDRAVVPSADEEGLGYLVIPLRDMVTHDRLLGALVIRPQAEGEVDREEEETLRLLSQQMALALRNAVDFRQFAYQRTTWGQILEMNKRIERVQDEARERNRQPEAARAAILDEVARAISTALGFRRVVISVIEGDHGQICGMTGLAPADEQAHRGQKRPRAVLESPDHEIYRHGSSSSFFIPEGCYNYELWQGAMLSDEPYEAPPWGWHEGDVLRTRVQNARGETLAYIIMDQRKTGRPGPNTFDSLEVFATRVADILESLAYERQLEVIKEVGDQLSGIRRRDELFGLVHEQLQRLMYAENILIGRYDPAAEQIRVLYLQPETAEPVRPEQYSVHEGLTGYIIRQRTPLRFDSAEQIAAFHTARNIRFMGRPAYSWMGALLRVEDEVIGVIALQDFERERVYDEQDLRVLQIFSDSVASAVRRIELEEERAEATVQAMNDVGRELIGATVSSQRVEHLILEKAVMLTNADRGLFLHYDKHHNRLESSGDWYVRDPAGAGDVKVERLELPLRPPDGTPASLSVHIALGKKVRKYDNVREEPDYIFQFPETGSLIGMPLYIRDPQQPDRDELVGVWTLESRRERAFTEAHVGMLETLSQFAVQAVLRVREQEQANMLLAWATLNVNSSVLQHHLPNLTSSLRQHVRNTVHDVDRLAHAIEETITEARLRSDSTGYGIRRMAALRLNKLVRDFLADYHVLDEDRTITLELTPYLPDTVTVQANRWGMEEVLTIILDNAYTQLLQSERDRRIEISTDQKDGALLLAVFDSGPSLAPEVQAFLEHPDARWDSRYEGLSRLKLLLSLYGASVRVRENDDEGVELAVCFPPPGTPRPRQRTIHAEQRRLAMIQEDIARRHGQRFLQEVGRRGTTWLPKLRQVVADLDRTNDSVEAINAALSTELDARTTLHVHAVLAALVSEIRHWKTYEGIPVHYQGAARLGAACVQANAKGLTLVLHNLLENAARAIRRGQAGEVPLVRDRPSITIEAECRDDEVIIQVRNTGPLVPPEIWDRLTRAPVPPGLSGNAQGHGIGLLLDTVVLTKYGGVLVPTANDLKDGVVFTIHLPRADGPGSGELDG